MPFFCSEYHNQQKRDASRRIKVIKISSYVQLYIARAVKIFIAFFNLITSAINNSQFQQQVFEIPAHHFALTRMPYIRNHAYSVPHRQEVPTDQKIINCVFMYPSRRNIMNSKKNLVEKGVYSFRRLRFSFNSIQLIRIALKLMVNAWRMKKLSLYIF